MDKEVKLRKKSETDYKFSIKESLEELDHQDVIKELKMILQRTDEENPFCNTLFKGKYQVFLSEKLVKWIKPFGVYKQAVVFCRAKPKGTILSKVKKYEESVELSGAPLDMKFDSLLAMSFDSSKQLGKMVYDLTKELSFLPIPQIVGRKLLYLCKSAEIETLLAETPALVISYHDENPKLCVILGQHKKDNISSNFLVNHLGTIKKREHLPRLDVLKKGHLKNFPKSSSVDMLVTAQYDFTHDSRPTQTESNPQDIMDLMYKKLSVQCDWSNASHILEPIPDDTRCFVTIDGILGGGASHLHLDLKLLEDIHSGLKSNDFHAWYPRHDVPIMGKLEELLNTEKSTLSKMLPSFTTVISWDNFDSILLKSRRNLDFTDKVWEIIKDSSQFPDLRSALLFVFSSLTDASFTPFVFSSKKSKFAHYVREIPKKPDAAPKELNPELAAMLLLEIGVESLRRDVVDFFLGLELAPIKYLSYFFEPGLLEAEAVARLRKIHNVIEVIIICAKKLNLTNNTLTKFVRSTLKSLSTTPGDELMSKYHFEIPLGCGEIRPVLNKMRPVEWRIRFLSKTEGYEKVTFHHFETAPERNIYPSNSIHPKEVLKINYTTGLMDRITIDKL